VGQTVSAAGEDLKMDVSRRSEDTLRTGVRSPGGGIVVRTTDRGVPLAMRLDQREMSKPPTQLAQEILLLCQLSAKRMQAAQRRDLVDRGVSPAVIRGLNLSTDEEVARIEAQLLGDEDDPPHTWMSRV
jgi:hypothetical protein